MHLIAVFVSIYAYGLPALALSDKKAPAFDAQRSFGHSIRLKTFREHQPLTCPEDLDDGLAAIVPDCADTGIQSDSERS